MNHLSQEEMILAYYGESDEFDGHLNECGDCGARYASLTKVLDSVDAMPVPARGAEYPQDVWQRIEHEIPVARQVRKTASWVWALRAAAALVLLMAGFLAGRYSPTREAAPVASADPTIGERVLRVAVADHLERSQMVLAELVNADLNLSSRGRLNISSERELAEELLRENRLYRQTALLTGQGALAGVLEDLEHVLLDIAHTPSEISPQELAGLRERLQAEGIVFKLRVLRSNVRTQREQRL